MLYDYSVYFIADSSVFGHYDVLEIIQRAAKGGITMVQLREKEMHPNDFIAYAREVRKIVRPFDIPMIINDLPEVADAADADGVHLGLQDASLESARDLLGPRRLIGMSAHTCEEALAAERAGADYIGVGTVYPTTTKNNIRGLIGVGGFRQIRQAVHIPAVAIGGITCSNAVPLIREGAAGIAVVSAIMKSLDPEKTATELRQLWKTKGRSRA